MCMIVNSVIFRMLVCSEVSLSVISNCVLFAITNIFLIEYTEGIAFRSFGTERKSFNGYNNTYSLNPNCSGETALSPNGCSCALLGQKCYSYGSICVRSKNTGINPLSSDAKNGNIKLGTCSCGELYRSIPTNLTCQSACIIGITAGVSSPANIDGCLCSNSSIPGLNMTTTFCALPVQFLLTVISSNSSDFTPYINIDVSTREVYTAPYAPSVVTTQSYAVVGIDAKNFTSNALIFTVVIQPAPVDSSTCFTACT